MTEESEADKFLKPFKEFQKDAGTAPLLFVDKDGKLLTEEKIKFYSDKMLDMLIDIAGKKKDYGVINATLKTLIEIKKAWHPATLKSINANINTNFSEQLKQFYTVRQAFNNDSKEIIIEEIKKAEKEADTLDEIDKNGGC
jgi:hypothetical protein